MGDYKWKWLTENYRVPKCTHIIDIPRDCRLLVMHVSGLKARDNVILEVEGTHVMYSGQGDFNNGYIFCDIEASDYSDVRLKIEVASLRSKIRVAVFGKWF